MKYFFSFMQTFELILSESGSVETLFYHLTLAPKKKQKRFHQTKRQRVW